MLGKLQRRLSRIWIVRPDAVLTTGDLARAAFPRARGVITHNHRRSVRRAALAVARPVGPGKAVALGVLEEAEVPPALMA